MDQISSIRGLPELGRMEEEDVSYVQVQEWELNNNAYDDDDPIPTSLLPIAAAAFGDDTLVLQEQHNSLFLCDDDFNYTSNMTPLVASNINVVSVNERGTKHMKRSSNNSEISEHTVVSSNINSNLNVSFANSSSNYMMNQQMGFHSNKQQDHHCLSPTPTLLHITNNNVAHDVFMCQQSLGNPNYGFNNNNGNNNATILLTSTSSNNRNRNNNNAVSQPQDHIIAERKRREKLSQRFIALSALVPGLKKMDKVSVLGDAIKYMKQLQEKVKSLEEEEAKGKIMESVVIVKKCSEVVFGDDGELARGAADSTTTTTCSSSNYNSDICDDQHQLIRVGLPEIEGRICERSVLIRIHCHKSKGVVEKAMSVVQNLHLTITNTSAFTFGTCALDLTIIAQMDKEFCITLEDLVRNLRSAFKSFM